MLRAAIAGELASLGLRFNRGAGVFCGRIFRHALPHNRPQVFAEARSLSQEGFQLERRTECE